MGPGTHVRVREELGQESESARSYYSSTIVLEGGEEGVVLDREPVLTDHVQVSFPEHGADKYCTVEVKWLEEVPMFLCAECETRSPNTDDYLCGECRAS